MTVATARVTIGLERLLDRIRRGAVRGRVGLVSNPASVDAALNPAADRLANAPGITLAALFGPQHGYRSDLQDNMIETPHADDDARRIPVYSLYSETREPIAAMLEGLDLLVIDLQNIGTRIYTFVYTMANCLRACARHGVKAVVCDRPNPIGGARIEGPMLREGWTSFVGQFPIPMRHGMTIGELARLFNEHFGIGADLEVVPMEGWRREMYFDQTGLPWVMPSPNMPTLDTAIVFPGAVLFEGTNISEGRGTTRPFELVGAPWIDGERLTEAMHRRDLPGVRFRAVFFEPTFQKHAQQTCGGCQIHVTDRAAFQPVASGVALLEEFRRQDPAQFGWKPPPYEYEYERLAIDLLYGSDTLRRDLESGRSVEEITASWEAEVRDFLPIRERYLLY
ncbi:MAG: exo-beta-N-acetylmuramidase NamZ family protein [Vicinamibacterales bacterium]